MIAFGLGLAQGENFGYNLGSDSPVDGGGSDSAPSNTVLWDDGTPVLWDDGTYVLWDL